MHIIFITQMNRLRLPQGAVDHVRQVLINHFECHHQNSWLGGTSDHHPNWPFSFSQKFEERVCHVGHVDIKCR